jgi:hypothetical protein
MDFKSLCDHLDPARIITCLNEIIDAFDRVGDNYDVFKLETKADASYMVVAGLTDRSHTTTVKSEISAVRFIFNYPQSFSCISIVKFAIEL